MRIHLEHSGFQRALSCRCTVLLLETPLVILILIPGAFINPLCYCVVFIVSLVLQEKSKKM